MFTVEMDWDELSIRILDQTGEHEDVEFIVYDDIVYIRQWNEILEKHTLITMSPIMFDELTASMDLPEGSYMLQKGDSD
jgi:hypothetical protein